MASASPYSQPNPPPRPTTADAQPAAPPAPPVAPAKKAKGKKEGLPAYLQQPFMKQITRNQAIIGKLLEDNTMVRVLRGASSNDVVYEPKLGAQSHSRDLGQVRRFGEVVGRLPLNRVGTRAAADGTFPSHWRPTAAPNDHMTRPASASSGVAFQRQITRKQDVNGKLLENIAMTRFLFGNIGNGPEYYDRAYDSLMQPLQVSHRPKVGAGQHKFTKQTGRLPLNRVGTRAAADGTFPSHWEPGMGYSETMENQGKSVSNFGKQSGRIELHLSGAHACGPSFDDACRPNQPSHARPSRRGHTSEESSPLPSPPAALWAGMRGAPPKASLAADYQGPGRPQSAMAVLRGGTGDAPGHSRRRAAPAAADARPIPENPKKHVQVHAFTKQLTREQWTSLPIR